MSGYEFALCASRVCMFAYPSIVLTYKYATIRKPGSGMKSRQRLSSTQTSSLHEVLLGVIVLDHEPGLGVYVYAGLGCRGVTAFGSLVRVKPVIRLEKGKT
jgi:hypothetical protein